MAIEHSISKALNQVDLKSRSSGNGSGSGGGSSIRSDNTFHKCGQRGNLKKDCRSKGNGSSGNPPKKSADELPGWVTEKPIISHTKDTATATMTRNHNNYKWCTYCNNGPGAWGFHWKDCYEEWKNKQGKKISVHFPILTPIV